MHTVCCCVDADLEQDLIAKIGAGILVGLREPHGRNAQNIETSAWADQRWKEV